ncbi:phosphodiester glycosidase family protein [Microcoleus sp. D2_18a_D3]|uniref:phosphodiester glycosidase family protein n=1 Tax=Microcoleus sp. D2_18a_D3 TaxID=3055330 RepID=UPI002FD30E28
MKRNFVYWRLILSVSILPVLAIVPSLLWNQPGRTQEREMAGLIDASRTPQGMNSLADSESRLKPTEILTDSPLERTSAMRQGFQPLSDYRFLAQSVPPSSIIRQGRQVSLNGRILPLSGTQHLIDASRARQGMNSLADSESRLKPTEILTDSPLERTSAMRQGFQPLSDYRFLAQSVPPSSIIRQGRQVSLNDRILPLTWTQHLIDASRTRQGMNSLADSESRLKPTEILTDSPLERTSAMRQGLKPLSDYRFLAQSVPPSSIIRQGRQVSLNGRILPLTWTQQPANSTSANFRTWIADVGLMQSAGVDLLSSADSAKQPVQWFSVSLIGAQSLAARATGSYRYLDVTDFASLAGWQISADGNVLRITSPAANVTGIRQAEIESGDRIVVDIDRPAPWQVNFVNTPSPSPTPTPNPPDDPTKPAIPLQNLRAAPNLETPDDPTKPALPLQITPAAPIAGQEWSIAIDAKVAPAIIQQTFSTSKQLLSLKVEPDGAQTKVKVTIPLGWRPQVFSLGNPNRLVIDIRSDSLVEKNIVWAPGVQWRQQYQNLGTARFPVVWLEVNPRQAGVKIRPILSNPPAGQGTAPLLQTAEISGAAASINAGFFNRINRLALGAIRRDNKWLSGPILNRGAIAWNDRGEFAIDRLTLQETLITSANQSLPVSHLNSAYVQPGIGRYNSDWGTTYTPLSGNEIVVTVAGDRVVSQSPGGAVGTTSFPIPANGYILAWRADLFPASELSIGTLLRLETNTFPAEFNRFPYILGGGPVLVQNSQVVLDAKAEGFSDAYVRQTAIRSAIGRTAAGNLLIVAVHNRAGGAGPNFAELAQILQQMGAVEALNLDGGSSTSLYLGGSLLDRPPSTAARVHNAIGIFIQP